MGSHRGADWVQLLRDDRPNTPVAAYHKEKRYMRVLRMSQYPYVEVDPDPSTIEGLDYLIGELCCALR